eukprot:10063503-Alexandrium_andersonii.AAC.1
MPPDSAHSAAGFSAQSEPQIRTPGLYPDSAHIASGFSAQCGASGFARNVSGSSAQCLRSQRAMQSLG